jgi:hypothetical protein
VLECTSVSTDDIRRRWACSGKIVARFRVKMKDSKIAEVASGHTADGGGDDDSIIES